MQLLNLTTYGNGYMTMTKTLQEKLDAMEKNVQVVFDEILNEIEEN